jgi:hypothetical protein
MAKKYTVKYNRGFSGQPYKAEFNFSEAEQEARLKQRKKSYKIWKEQGSEIAQEDIENTPRNIEDVGKIGSVSSSWLTSLGYIGETGEAVATFRGVSAEFYYKMPYSKFLEWLNSPSKGKWLHEHSEVMGDYEVRGGIGRKSFSTRIRDASQGGRKKGGKLRSETQRRKTRQYLEKYR